MSKESKNHGHEQNPGARKAGPGGGFGPMGMGMPVQKAKDFKGTLKRLVGYLKPHKLQLFAVLITAIISTVFSIVSPKIMGKATTKLFEGLMMKLQGVPGAKIDFDYIGQIIILLIGLYIFSAIFAYLQGYIMAGVAQKTVYNLRKEVEEKLNRLPLKYFDSRTHGEILSRAVNDVDNISTTLQQSLTQLITSVVTIIGVIVMMLSISPLMTLIVILTLPLSGVAIAKIAKKSQQYFKGQQKSLGQLNGHVEEMYTGHKVIKVFGHEQKSIEQFEEINEKLYQSGWKAQFVSGMIMPLMSFINNIGYVLISVVGGILVTTNAIKIGDIQAFIQYARQFSQPIAQTASIANVIQSTIASAERVFEILDETEEVPEAVAAEVITEPKGEVTFEHVSFGYEENEPLIEDMNIDVKPGQRVAIVGPTGAGKTTLINLLMRFYEIDSGKILIDGIDTREYETGASTIFVRDGASRYLAL